MTPTQAENINALTEAIQAIDSGAQYGKLFESFIDFSLYFFNECPTLEETKVFQDILDSPQKTAYLNAVSCLGKASMDFTDAIGGAFMSANLKGSRTVGQVFTPQHIAEFMANLATNVNGEFPIDTCCGSGRMLLAAAKTAKERNRPLFFAIGADLDELCVKMTTLNLLLQSLTGYIYCGNAITDSYHKVYKVWFNGKLSTYSTQQLYI